MGVFKIPDFCMVVLMGASGSGKSSFARKHFLATEVLSSDFCRGLVGDDENDQSVTPQAFEVLHTIAAKRLALRRLTVIDATNVQPESRKPLVELARAHHCLPVAIVMDLPERLCMERNRGREDRTFGEHVVRNQASQLKRSLRGLQREGFRQVYSLRSLEEVDDVVIERVPLWTDRRGDLGPFDIIGDLHGCFDELEELLALLGYTATAEAIADPVWGSLVYRHPEGRKAAFVGDLVDRGPRVLDTVRLVRNMVNAGSAICVPGNHDVKLVRKLHGKNVQIKHGLAETIAEIEAVPESERPMFTRELTKFLDSLVSHYLLDGGRLVIAHAGMKESMQGRASGRVREFALYGETTGETDEFGLPIRFDWASEYRGRTLVAYGHTPVPEAEWLNNTINLDTGCVFGGKLTALRYPERELVSVPARRMHATPVRPISAVARPASNLSSQQVNDHVLDASDVIGKRLIETRLRGRITIREENSAAALEVMSRFAADPRWLIYLPPTMSPSETSQLPGFLEHPAEAVAYYRKEGVQTIVCEEKHMGSRCVVVVCEDEAAAGDRFGVDDGSLGIVVTRTGRRFFQDEGLERELLDRVRLAVGAAGLWKSLTTRWMCLDCELLPWSAKAQDLLRTQYAAVGASGQGALPAVLSSLRRFSQRGIAAEQATAAQFLHDYDARLENLSRFVASYRHYCWPVNRLDDLKLAPFHLLASEGQVHADKNHVWHMETLASLCRADQDLLRSTPFRSLDLSDEIQEKELVEWWTELTERGGEGMVVKSHDFLHTGRRGLIQPALKCRGREYLRIIYGPDYTSDANLSRLRSRGLGRKRSLALRELALGIEGLERFVRREPLRRVHECVFGVLALESEPVDPRL